MTLKERLLEKMVPEPNTGCWLWFANTQKNGYGKIKFNGKTMRSHRVSWMVHRGEIPEGLLVCHKCDVRACINPDHLFLGDQKKNIGDCLSKGRFKGGEHCREKKINEKEEKEILRALSSGLSQHKVAEIFGIGRSLVCSIKLGTRWSKRSIRFKSGDRG